MKNIIRIAICVLVMCIVGCTLVSCDLEYSESSSTTDKKTTIKIAEELASSQPTPNDIEYSLERYNLIRRAYWVNGQREKAMNVPCPVERPMGYVVLMTNSGAVVGRFTVDGKVTSLNSYLTPDSEYYELVYGGTSLHTNKWLADVDGSYGSNDDGIFFFTTDGKYIEWNGTYLYSDIPFTVENPIITVAGE